MLDAAARRISAMPLDAAARTLARYGVTANIATAIGFIIGVLAVIFFAFALYGVGLLFLTLNRLFDGLDGALARRRGITERGEFLDGVLSYLVFAAVPFAFALADPQSGLAASFMILGILIVAVTELGMRGYISLPTVSSTLPRWFILCERSETFLVIAVMALLPWAFSLFAYLFGALCFVTGGMRIAAALAASDRT
jgi:phosphatidylglycerophosphate synthase